RGAVPHARSRNRQRTPGLRALPEHARPFGNRSDQIAALRRAAGEHAVELIRREPNPAIEAMIESWPRQIDGARAQALGFRAESSFDEIIRTYIEDELGGRLPSGMQRSHDS